MTKQIWIVDDNEDSRALACAILSQEYQLVEIESGARALELLDVQRPDLLLLDLTMPGIDGVAVLGAVRVRADLAHLPVIAYTARASHPERRRIVEYGFDHCVVKPVMHERDLLEPIAQLLSRAAA